MVSLTRLAHTSKLAERVKVAMSVRRNFSTGSATSTFCLSFSSCWRCNANGSSQNALLFQHHKENAPWKHALHSHLFWKLFQVQLYTNLPQRCTFCHPLQFCWIGAYSHKWVWNGPELSKNTFAVVSLVCAGWTELTSEFFCPNCFLHFAYQKCFFFSYSKLPNIHTWERFLQIGLSHNFRTINDQITISGKKHKVKHSRKTVSNNEKWIYTLTRLSDNLLKLELTKIRTPRRRKNWVDELWKLAAVNIALHLVLAQKSELSHN